MAQSHSLLGMNVPASPPEALPTQTFKTTHALTLNGEQIALGYVPPAHTDTDIYIHFTKGNVLHLGDLYLNGSYPFIDASTGGRMNGMIAAAETGIRLANATTKIVPGHGPLGDRASLTTYRDMLSTVRDRVQKLKSSGQTRDQVIAANPTAEFDAAWGKGPHGSQAVRRLRVTHALDKIVAPGLRVGLQQATVKRLNFVTHTSASTRRRPWRPSVRRRAWRPRTSQSRELFDSRRSMGGVLSPRKHRPGRAVRCAAVDRSSAR